MSEVVTPDPPPEPEKHSRKTEIPEAVQAEVLRLRVHYGTREIAKRTGISRRLVRRVLRETHGPPSPRTAASKLAPYRECLVEKVEKGLTATRIHRELRALGYAGGRTMLAEQVRALRASIVAKAKKGAKRRFETRVAKEMQIDWSNYLVKIGGELVRVHALGVLLCHSRKLWLGFYKDERQSTLLEGLATSFEYFLGCAARVVLDNMATAVLGRIGPKGGEPLWHPRFADFVEHYGFEAFACRVKDPDRKGKKEKSFRLVEDDFLKGTEFASWEDLQARTKVWLDETPEVANRRVHGTTRLVPNEVWLAERELLIKLPARRFAVHEDEVRLVDRDATLSVRGTRYTVPATLANRSVGVRLYAEHFEVVDKGRVILGRAYVASADKGKLQIDPTHYASLPWSREGSGSSGRLDEAFVKRFPALASLVEGLKLKMKALAPVHVAHLLRLVDRFGEPAFLAAATKAQEHRRFSSRAVERILEREHEAALEENLPVTNLPGSSAALALGEVESGSLDDYDHLDRDDASSEDDDRGS
jgi:transposase